jgi:hypothetical protein
MEMSPSWEETSCVATQDFPNIYGNRRFITVSTRGLHWSVSWVRSIQFIPPHPIVLVFLLVSFLLAFPQKPYIHSFMPHSCYMPCPSHPPWLDHSNYLREEYKLWSSSLCSFLQPPVTSFLFDPNILLNTLFSNTLNICSSLIIIIIITVAR